MHPRCWKTARNILCVRLDSLGDVLMTTPALRAVRESLPGRKVTLLTSPAGAALKGLVPLVDDWITYAAPWMKATSPRENSQIDRALIDLLRQRHFDAAIIFTVFSQNPLPAAMLCYLAEIPLRLAHCRENPYGLLTDWAVETEPHQGIRHEVRRQLDLVSQVGYTTDNDSLAITPAANDVLHVQRMIDSFRLARDGRWVVLHPGASAPSRRYPHYAQAARLLIEQGFSVIFTGSREEVPLVDWLQQQLPSTSRSLAGQLTLGELAALISLAPLVITNNTGPAHLAAAVGTPVIDLYALTNPQHTPWKVAQRVLYHDVPCRDCFKSICPQQHHDCLAKVSPEQVVEAALELLQSSPATAPTHSNNDTTTPVLAGGG